jgi:hypothetical protein
MRRVWPEQDSRRVSERARSGLLSLPSPSTATSALNSTATFVPREGLNGQDMTTRRVRYLLYLDAAQVEELRAISKRTKIPASVIAREGIDEILKKYQKQPAAYPHNPAP